ncbi:MAG: hypothetical protein OSA99_21045 [Acidimicrobiales bacterium]|nr:hypothetical protein [Acidimicrobiales bacterium]
MSGPCRVDDENPPAWTAEPIRDFIDFHRASRDQIAAALAFTTGSAALGAEAADEAVARAFARWSAVAAMDNPSGWVYRTGLNWARSWRRRHRREKLGADNHQIGVTVDRADVDLARAMTDLDDKHRAVVVLRYYLGHSTADTAQILAVSEGTVKSRLSRALDKLHNALETDDD